MGGAAADYKLAAVEELSSSVSRAHARGLPISPQVRGHTASDLTLPVG